MIDMRELMNQADADVQAYKDAHEALPDIATAGECQRVEMMERRMNDSLYAVFAANKFLMAKGWQMMPPPCERMPVVQIVGMGDYTAVQNA